uniref:Uncharacterized protein n=1 Tax=Avena sativa TaxID=4498 RepID=A0ACD5UY50_AVESA
MPSSKPPSVPPAPSLQLLPPSAVRQNSRIDLCEIKSKIVKKIGPDRAKKYFQHLERFLSSKLSKNEFDKLCLVALDRENLPLHNHLIRSVLLNACAASGPPAINASRIAGDVTCSEHTLVPPVWNGDALSKHVKDKQSLGRSVNALPQHSSLSHGETISRENGAPNLIGLRRHIQVQQTEHVEPLTKRSCAGKALLNNQGSLHSNGPSAIDARETLGGETIRRAQLPVQAPIGIQFGAANLTRKPSALASVNSDDDSVSCYDNAELCDTLSLRKKMEKTAQEEGLEGVSIECADLLNNGVDMFLKQLIGSCVELVGARSQHGKLSHAALKQQLSRKLINGVSLQNHAHVQGGIIAPGTSNSISMQDLKAVSGLNPRLLGVNASEILEKINSHD